MESGNRRNTSGLIEDLVKNGPSYNVWQAIWIGENITKKDNPGRKDYLFEQTGLNFHPNERYEYPPRDIRSISYENGMMTIILTFMGLYGINSPLPRCYHEQVALQQRLLGTGEVPLQNFLDIFNNRFYFLYYQAWKKYRFYLHLNGEIDNKITERINSFTGRGLFSKILPSDWHGKKAAIPDFVLLKFSGLLSQRVRNKAGLRILISHLFPQYEMQIEEFVPRWVELEDIPELGNNASRLGENNFIGESTLDYSSRICIQISPLSFGDYLDFLPGKEKSNLLVEILQLFLNDGLEFDFKFRIKADTIVSVSWDDERLKLGSTLWLGKPQSEFVNVYLNYEEIIRVN